jgi:peptidase M28-like protein
LKRGVFLRFSGALALLLAASAHAAPVTSDQLRRHIAILAGDDFEGRAPGTEGEARTLRYIAGQFEALGLEPAGAGGGWYQPVGLVVRRPAGFRTRWLGPGGTVELSGDSLILTGTRAEERIRGAPVVFAAHGAVMPEHGIDQLAGAELRGAVVLLLYDAPDVAGFPAFAERVKAVAARGAAAVIGIVGDDIPWKAYGDVYRSGQNHLAIESLAPVRGVMSQAAAARLVGAAGGDFGQMLNALPGPAFTAVPLALKAWLRVETEIRSFTSSNVAARLRGSGATGQSLLYLAHWDHLGLCRPEGEPDRICNGAVDNASGVAALIEIARGLTQGPRPKRDVLFLATTAEETGLLGAEYFAARPIVPLASIVAAFNLDMVAIAERGQEVVVIGRGIAPLDRLIEETAREQGRSIDGDEEADEFLERQDGWALRRAGVPAVMVGGAFSDMAVLAPFLSGPYHQPGDDLRRAIPLGGAAEDADLLIALGRKLADPARYRPPARGQSN